MHIDGDQKSNQRNLLHIFWATIKGWVTIDHKGQSEVIKECLCKGLRCQASPACGVETGVPTLGCFASSVAFELPYRPAKPMRLVSQAPVILPKTPVLSQTKGFE